MKKNIYYICVSLFVCTHGANTAAEQLLREQEERFVSNLENNKSADILLLLKRQERMRRCFLATLTCSVVMSICVLIMSFVSAGEKIVSYMPYFTPSVEQTIYENTQDPAGLGVSIAHLILLLPAAYSASKIISNGVNKTIALWSKILMFLSTLFVFVMLGYCATTTSGGAEKIIFGPDSHTIPITNLWENNCWYCGVTGDRAAPNVFPYYFDRIEDCIQYNFFGDGYCVWDSGFLTFSGIGDIYVLMLFYFVILLVMLVGWCQLSKGNTQLEQAQKEGLTLQDRVALVVDEEQRQRNYHYNNYGDYNGTGCCCCFRL